MKTVGVMWEGGGRGGRGDKRLCLAVWHKALAHVIHINFNIATVIEKPVIYDCLRIY